MTPWYVQIGAWAAGVAAATALWTVAAIWVLKSQLGMAGIAMAIGMPL